MELVNFLIFMIVFENIQILFFEITRLNSYRFFSTSDQENSKKISI